MNPCVPFLDNDRPEACGQNPLLSSSILMKCEKLADRPVVAAILFGSHAKGVATSGSDVDVLFLTKGGKEYSLLYRLNSQEIHASFMPLESVTPKIPAKWWEPLASGQPLNYGINPQLASLFIKKAHLLWKSPDARMRAMHTSILVLQDKLKRLGIPPDNHQQSTQSARVRVLSDAILSVFSFGLGVSEPGKRRRISGLEKAVMQGLGPEHWNCYQLTQGLNAPNLLPISALLELVHHHFPAYLDWIEQHERDPFLLFLRGGPNRWHLDTALSAQENRHSDVRFYLSFVLDRLLLSTPAPPALLLAKPWYQELGQAVRASVAPNILLAQTSVLLERIRFFCIEAR